MERQAIKTGQVVLPFYAGPPFFFFSILKFFFDFILLFISCSRQLLRRFLLSFATNLLNLVNVALLINRETSQVSPYGAE